jgi:hypothetical protein
MGTMAVFNLQFGFNIVVCTMIIAWFVMPWLQQYNARNALMLLMFPHAMRCLGLTYLVPIVTDPNIPQVFSRTTAYGDFLTAGMALITIMALRYLPHTGGPDLAILLVWLFNTVGFVDLGIAFAIAARVEVFNYQLRSMYFVPAFVVPGLLVSHVALFWVLWKHHKGEWRENPTSAAA